MNINFHLCVKFNFKFKKRFSVYSDNFKSKTTTVEKILTKEFKVIYLDSRNNF